MSVNQRVLKLVAIGEEAVVAGTFAGLCAFPERDLVAGVGIEVGNLERLARSCRQRAGLGLKTAKHACATFRRLREQHAAAVLIVRQHLSDELGILQLERGLNTPLERVPQSDGRLRIHRIRKPQNKDVARVEHVRDHSHRTRHVGSQRLVLC